MYLARGHPDSVPLWVDAAALVVLFGLAAFFHFWDRRK